MPRTPAPPNWADLPDEELLNLRLADLPLKLAGSVIESRVTQLKSELEASQCPVRPGCRYWKSAMAGPMVGLLGKGSFNRPKDVRNSVLDETN